MLSFCFCFKPFGFHFLFTLLFLEGSLHALCFRFHSFLFALLLLLLDFKFGILFFFFSKKFCLPLFPSLLGFSFSLLHFHLLLKSFQGSLFLLLLQNLGFFLLSLGLHFIFLLLLQQGSFLLLTTTIRFFLFLSDSFFLFSTLVGISLSCFFTSDSLFFRLPHRSCFFHHAFLLCARFFSSTLSLFNFFLFFFFALGFEGRRIFGSGSSTSRLFQSRLTSLCLPGFYRFSCFSFSIFYSLSSTLFASFFWVHVGFVGRCRRRCRGRRSRSRGWRSFDSRRRGRCSFCHSSSSCRNSSFLLLTNSFSFGDAGINVVLGRRRLSRSCTRRLSILRLHILCLLLLIILHKLFLCRHGFLLFHRRLFRLGRGGRLACSETIVVPLIVTSFLGGSGFAGSTLTRGRYRRCIVLLSFKDLFEHDGTSCSCEANFL